ncbi:hypothetical protein Agub_g72, partial [Astrephomene gubernaculifera]
DEVTNGLDANTALSLVRALRNSSVHGNSTVLATLLQPSSEVFECFDDVMLMASGTIVFHGPREQLLPFFASLGLRPLPGQTAADFAQEVVASPEDQAKYRDASGAVGALLPGPAAGTQGGAGGGNKWMSPRQIRRVLEAGELGRQLAAQVAAPPYNHPLQDLVLHSQRYGMATWPMLWAVTRREVVLFVRNPQFFIAGMVQVLFIAFLVSTAFVNLRKSNFNDANLFLSVIFFSLTTVSMGGFSATPAFIKRLAVFYKQRDHRFYTPTTYALGICAVRVPEMMLQAFSYTIMVYFSVGFANDAGRFFLNLLNLVAIGFNNVTLFVMLGAFTRSDIVTQGLGAVSLMVNVLVSGFPIARTSIHGWWIWLYWLLPTSWTFRSMAIVELTYRDWAGHEEGSQVAVGENALLTRGFYKEWYWVWAGIGYVIGVSLFQLGLAIAALTWLGPVRGTGSGPEEEVEDDDLHLSPVVTHGSDQPSQYNGAYGASNRGQQTADSDAGAAPATIRTQSRAVPAVVQAEEGRAQTPRSAWQDGGAAGGATEGSGRRGAVPMSGAVQMAGTTAAAAGGAGAGSAADAVAVDMRGAAAAAA